MVTVQTVSPQKQGMGQFVDKAPNSVAFVHGRIVGVADANPQAQGPSLVVPLDEAGAHWRA